MNISQIIQLLYVNFIPLKSNNIKSSKLTKVLFQIGIELLSIAGI